MNRKTLNFSLAFFVAYVVLLGAAFVAGLSVYPHITGVFENVPAKFQVKSGQSVDILVVSENRRFLEQKGHGYVATAYWQDRSAVSGTPISFEVTSSDNTNGDLYGFGIVRLLANQDGEVTLTLNKALPDRGKLIVEEPLSKVIVNLLMITGLAVLIALPFYLRSRTAVCVSS